MLSDEIAGVVIPSCSCATVGPGSGGQLMEGPSVCAICRRRAEITAYLAAWDRYYAAYAGAANGKQRR